MLIKNIKLIFLTGTIVLLSLKVMAQNPGFVQTDIIKVAGVTTDAQINTLPLGNIQTTRVFIDGLGRSVQAVALQASPVNNKDIVEPQVYNTLGQQTISYLPYTDNSTINPIGSFRTSAINDQLTYYSNSGTSANPNGVANETSAPFSQQLFENSPMQRVISAGMTGAGFQPTVSGNKYKTVSYRLNNGAQDGNIMLWTTSGTYASGTNYADNTLYVTDGIDEDGLEARSFTDAAGKLILKRQLKSGANVDTYYIYNLGGVVSYIIPPLALASMVSSGNYSLSAAPVNTMIFVFTYDNMGRLIEKTVPAKGKMNVVYDPMNRPVLVQDANMQASNKWNYVKYDVKGRAINQGTYIDNTYTSRTAMQTYVNGLASNYNTTWYESRTTAGSFNFYTNTIFPTGNLTPMGYAYFDDYDVDNNGVANYAYSTQGLTGEVGATTAPIKGMPTISIQNVVGSGVSSSTWLTKVVFYDKRGNPIQTRNSNHVYYTGGFAVTDVSTMVPDFVGVPQITKVSKMSSATVTTTVQTSLTYDYMDRVKSVSQAYNGGVSTIVASYTYNELGQLVTKNLGNYSSGEPVNLNLNTIYSGTNSFTATSSITLSPGFSAPSGSTFSATVSSGYLQTVDMRYNIRGQLLSINNSQLNNDGGLTNNDTNDVFGIVMLYDKVDANLSNTPYYNGKISAVKWMSRNGTGGKSWERGYKYSYDGINQYTSAIYAERDTINTGTFSNNVDGFDETVSYDAGGNITGLTRNSSTQGTNTHMQIDNLAYTYDPNNPNQLKTVTDGTDGSHTGAGFRNLTNSAGNYTYDGNGNLTADPYKGLALAYDVLNRTDKITVTTGTNRWVDYTYNVSGQLIRKRQYDNNVLQNTTDYVDGFVYINGTLSYFPMPEGRVLNIAGTLKQEFIITDQQGNARVSFQANANGHAVVMQENSYYTTGLIMPNSPVATPTTPNKQLYNGGSEWQNDYSNLPDYYQTFNRNYDAAIGRFIGVDPIAESAESMTTYQYAGNNPVKFNDPMGDKFADPFSYPAPYHPNGDNFNWAGDAYGGGGYGGGGGGGLYSSDPGLANYLATTGSENIYHSGNGKASDPSTGSLANGLGAYVAAGGEVVDGNGVILIKSGYSGGIATWTYADGRVMAAPNKINDDQFQIKDGESNWTSVASQGGCPTCVVPSTVGHNILGDNYTGGNNPMNYNGTYNYSMPLMSKTDGPSLGHDRRYDRVGVAGPGAVFSDTRTSLIDLRFVGEQFEIAFNPGNYAMPTRDPMSAISGFKSLVAGLGILFYSAPKMINQTVTNPSSWASSLGWYYYSNIGVNNVPSK